MKNWGKYISILEGISLLYEEECNNEKCGVFYHFWLMNSNILYFRDYKEEIFDYNTRLPVRVAQEEYKYGTGRISLFRIFGCILYLLSFPFNLVLVI